jgi:predicted ATP-binding protein involved in virulence
MRLEQLQIKNYRCFENLTIDFHPELTVLIAPNGAGKTTILDAARVAVWPFVKGFDLGSQTGKSASIQIDDVRLLRQADGNMEAQLPSSISATGSFLSGDESMTWVQKRERTKANTSTLLDSASKAATALGKTMEAMVRAPQGDAPLTLPLMTYLGTSRLWYEGRFTSEAEDTTLDVSAYSRTSGYLNCLSYSSSFKAFKAWYGWVYRAYRENQIEAIERSTPLSEAGQRFATAIQCVKTAVDALVTQPTGWHSLEYSASHNQHLVMHHDELGTMPVDLLSDGLRNAIAMVSDLAFRAHKLNPHFGDQAALQTPGIALIDEVDMFLHPSWQQSILGSLRAAFPKLQFIVTTHSPQVLSTIRRENIRVLNGNSADMPLATTYGQPSGDVMHSVMMVNPQPPIAEAPSLARLTALVDQGLWEDPEAATLMAQLQQTLEPENARLQQLQRSIQRQTMLRDLSQP